MRLARLRCALAVAPLLFAALAYAQDAPAPAATPPAAASPSAAPTPVEPIPLPVVAEQGEEILRKARRLEDVATPAPEVQRIEATLPETAAQLEERRKRVERLSSDPTSLIALEEELKVWELAQEQLGASLTVLTERLTELEVALDDLTHQRQVWKVTEEAAREAAAPDAVVGRIREVRDALRETKRTVEQRRDALLSLQAEVAEEEKRTRVALDALTDARKSFRSLILLRDSPPLWTAARAEHADIAPDMREVLDARWRALARFYDARKERLLVHFALLCLAVAATLALRRRATEWRADDPRLEASAVIFERHYSAALLFVASLTPVLHPRAPRLADMIGLMLVVVPAVRLLPRLVEPALVPAVYALAAFATFDRARDVFARSVFLERSLLFVEVLAAFAVLFWLLRPARLSQLPAGAHIPRALGATLRLALAALGVAVLAICFGWVHLGRALAEGVLGSAYAAAVIYGGVRVVRTAVRAALRSDTARRLDVVRRHGDDIGRWVRRAIHFGAFASWAFFALSSFGIEDWVLESGARVLGAEAQFGEVGVSLGDLLAFGFTLAGAILLGRAVRLVLEDELVPRLPAGRGIGHAVTNTVHYAILLLGFLLAISAGGVDLDRISLLAGAFGVGIGFGLQNVVNNFVSGLILLYERPVQLGDMVEVGGTTGEVRRIGIRSSTIRTFQGAEVIVPNSSLISDRVVNWTFSDRRRRMEIKIGVAYGSDPGRVLALLAEVAKAHPDVLEDPPPQALMLGFGESTLDFELRAWTGLYDSFAVTQSELLVAIAHALGEAGIEVPFPQRDLHLRTVVPDAARALRDEGR